MTRETSKLEQQRKIMRAFWDASKLRERRETDAEDLRKNILNNAINERLLTKGELKKLIDSISADKKEAQEVLLSNDLSKIANYRPVKPSHNSNTYTPLQVQLQQISLDVRKNKDSLLQSIALLREVLAALKKRRPLGYFLIIVGILVFVCRFSEDSVMQDQNNISVTHTLTKKPSTVSVAPTGDISYQGKWSWETSDGYYWGYFTLVQHGNTFEGTFDNVVEGFNDEKISNGIIIGNTISFTREGAYGIQYWEGTVTDTNGLLEINGRWQKEGSADWSDFYASKEELSTKPSNAKSSDQYATISSEVGYVNLRNSPGYINKNNNTDVITKISEGSKVEIIGGPKEKDELNWWKVSWNGYEGWIADHTASGKTILIFK